MAILSVNKWNGSIVYYTTGDSIYNKGWPPSNNGGGGGVSGGGGVWSSIEQVIWIKYNGAPPYPVKLKPGHNEIKFWIPTLYPEDVWVETKLEIIAPGYILIPAGFEWDVLTGENVPPPPPNDKRIDKLRFKDYYNIDINYVPPSPSDDKDNIDEYGFIDINEINIKNINKIIKDNIDISSYTDINDIDINNIATLIKDNIDKIGNNNLDTSSYHDVFDIDII